MTFKSKVDNYLKDKSYCKIDICIWGLIGAIIFIIIYGFTPLNVVYDKWLLNGYAEPDAAQHYAGWLAFRKSAWSLPLGSIDGFEGTFLTYTDSLPLVALFFKCISSILPETFQYFGLYIFACIILQAISSGLLISLFSKNKIFTCIGVILFSFSPIMLERAFRHCSLASHWMILYMLYFYFKSKKEGKIDWKAGIIPVITIGIHPYFLPIVFGIMFANIIDLFILSHKSIVRSSIIFLCSLAVTTAVGYLIGALGVSTSLGDYGFGVYSMNLNAIFNPISAGDFIWSRYLKVLPMILGNYDGFNYLGLGIIIGIIIMLISIILNKTSIFGLIKRNFALILLCLGFWLFALSNVVTLNDKILFQYNLPEKALSLASIFRASSRMFYPVYYMIFLAVIAGINNFSKQSISKAFLLLVLIIQIIDISPALQKKHELFTYQSIENKYKEGYFTGSTLWNDIADKHLRIKVLNWRLDYLLAVFGQKYDLEPEVILSSSHFHGRKDIGVAYISNRQEILSGNLDEQAVYVTTDQDLLDNMMMSNKNINGYYEDAYFILTSPNIELNGNKIE